MRAALRFLFVIPLGFVLACCAAAFTLLWPFLDLPPGALEDPFALFELIVGAGAQVMQVGSLAFLPFAVFVIVAEAFALRSLVLHIALGALAGFALSRSTGEAMSGSVETAMVVAGLSFFMTYWLVAGRGAGLRRRPDGPRRVEDGAVERKSRDSFTRP